MYDLVIADDEYLIRESLAKLVDWKALGFDISAVVCDGTEVIDILEKRSIDVLLIDIQMKKMSGLQVAKYICEKEINTRVVIISGHREFDFAQQAIQFGVKNYILKPTSLSDVTAVFCAIKQELDHKAAEDKLKLEEQQKYLEVAVTIREDLYSNIYSNFFESFHEIELYLSRFHLKDEITKSYFYLLNIKITEFDEYLLQADQMILNIIDMVKQDGNVELKAYVLDFSNAKLDLLIEAGKNDSERLNDIIANAKKTLNDICGIKSEYIEVSCFNEISELYDYLKNSKTEYNELSGFNEVDYYIENAAIQYLMIINMSELDENLEQKLFESFNNSFDELLPQKRVEIASKIFETSRGKLQRNYSISMDSCTIQADMKISTEDTFKSFFIDNVKLLINEFKNSQIDERRIVDIIKSIIKQDISKTISLNEISKQVFLTPNYLSRLFKKESGETFINFIISLKMDEACKYLSDHSLKVYDVARMVGYSDIKHFYKLFKRCKKCTPSEYRSKCKNISGGLNG